MNAAAVPAEAEASMTAVLWLRRDLRRADHPALVRAADEGDVLPLFVIDPALWGSCGAVRRSWLAASVRAAIEAYDGRLCVRLGAPSRVVPDLAREVAAATVHVTRETTPGGARRDEKVTAALHTLGGQLVATGTPYAVGPGLIRNKADRPFQVFTPFARAWRRHGWPAPADEPDAVSLVEAASDREALDLLAAAERECPIELPAAGERAALERWDAFLDGDLGDYADARDRPDHDGTSRMSPYLKVGAIHPRTLLADLAHRGGQGVERFITELAWREFYADVLWNNPTSAWRDLRSELSHLAYDDPDELVDAWRAGRTGYPIVDAGMRQLAATGWMHNRLRMITASFLTKDLHTWWPIGARHFLDHLIDGDLASNNHGWQWVAGTGTDAAPYFRVFNPVTQGLRFDPAGDYVRRWVPELGHLTGPAAHEPWRAEGGYARGYPARVVDHDVERKEALARYSAARGAQDMTDKDAR